MFNGRHAGVPAVYRGRHQARRGRQVLRRGLDYVNAVDHLEISDTEVTANVYGSSEYTVCLVIDDQRLSGGCTCPYGRDGFFCKHCVAVGLSVLELGDELPRHLEAARAQQQAVDAWLQSLSKEELLAELRGLLDENRELRQRFELRAAAMNTDALAIRRAVMDFIMPPRGEYLALRRGLPLRQRDIQRGRGDR